MIAAKAAVPRSLVALPKAPSTDTKEREWWRKSSRLLYFFCREILATAWQDKFQNFGVLQKHLCRFLQSSKFRKKFVSIFRGSFKTTVLLGYCLWLFCWAIADGKSLSICYNTSSKDNAAIFMEDFRQTLEKCERLHWVLPELPTKTTGYSRWTSKMVEYKGMVKFHVASLETRQVMRHYQVIINDDLVNDDNAFSETERKNIIRKWQLQKSILTKYKKFDIGTEIDVGTPYHHKDLISHIMKHVPTYEKFIVPYKISSELTMPEMYCQEDFDEKRAEMGPSLFATQYELNIIDDQDKLCEENQLRYWRELPASYQRLMIVDPGGIDRDKDDPSTGVWVCDIDPAGTFYSIHAEEYAVSPYNLIKLMERLKDQFNPDDIYMEKEKYSVTIADTIEHLQSRLNFSFVEPKGREKGERIHKIKQYLETGRILLGQGQRTFEDRLLNYPDCAKHLLDCVAYAVEVANPPKRGVARDSEVDRSSDFEQEMMRARNYNPAYRERQQNDWLF